jgi:hypothetical protein
MDKQHCSHENSGLKRFIQSYRQGSQIPEPGVALTGGVANPT